MTRRDLLCKIIQLGGALCVGTIGRSIIAATRGSAVDVPISKAVDHLLLGVSDLQEGIAYVENLTGMRASIGGKHPGVGTHNALLSLGNRQYLEIIAPDPEQTTLVARYEHLRQKKTPQLFTWAAASQDVQALATKASAAGLETAGPFAGSRARPDGRVLSWKTLAIQNSLGGVIPFFIEWGKDVVHPSEDAPAGCQLVTFELSHPEPQLVREMLRKLGIAAEVKRAQTERLRATVRTPKGSVELS
jgi:hypothetical protein